MINNGAPSKKATRSITTSSDKECKPLAPSFKKWDKGAHVTAIQNFLTSQGLLRGKVDGVYGQATRAAVTAFQTNEKIPTNKYNKGVFNGATLIRANSILCKQ